MVALGALFMQILLMVGVWTSSLVDNYSRSGGTVIDCHLSFHHHLRLPRVTLEFDTIPCNVFVLSYELCA
jgi:hypothetical protein